MLVGGLEHFFFLLRSSLSQLTNSYFFERLVYHQPDIFHPSSWNRPTVPIDSSEVSESRCLRLVELLFSDLPKVHPALCWDVAGHMNTFSSYHKQHIFGMYQMNQMWWGSVQLSDLDIFLKHLETYVWVCGPAGDWSTMNYTLLTSKQLLNMAIAIVNFRFTKAIFHSYLKLPEGSQ